MKIICVAGARPNFMKIAPIMEAFEAHPEIEPMLIHTGQHYDEAMSELFFHQLGISEPAINLGVGSASHAVQTANIMTAFEGVCLAESPEAVLVVGDVNSTIACGLVASKLGIALIHVEAGLRSFDRAMPEEINRVLTDRISDFLFVTEPSGVENLRHEGICEERIFFVGNVMIDTLRKNLETARSMPTLEEMGLTPRGYCTMTLHRPSNVDDKETLAGLLGAIEQIQQDMPLVFPIHPRTHKAIDAFGLTPRLESMGNLRLVEPLGYLDFLQLNANARCVLTDSGGLQEETTALGVPCITLRENTERPVTIDVGTNQLVGTDPVAILAAWDNVKTGEYDTREIPEKWDGQAAQRIAMILAERL
jgi:UDP-N-acetylglucosamine 2-epimerase (non-hydrolysing)